MAEIEEEKVFEHFPQVPANVRMRMIDKMKTEDRCRITRCSKSCSREARSSKNHFYHLEISSISEDSFSIRVTYEKNSRTHGYSLSFSGGRRKFMRYFTQINQRMPAWQIELDDSKDLAHFVIENFKRLLRNRKNEIIILNVYFLVYGDSEMWRNTDFEIESLENLEILSIHAPIDVQQFLSKIRHPLKELFVGGNQNNAIPANYKQIYQVQMLSWSSLGLDNQQLSRLSAIYIEIDIGKLTEKDIFNFIRAWQNGTIKRRIEFYRWRLLGSNFDRKKLLRLLRVADQETEYTEIKHFQIPGKSATLRQIPFSVRFGTPRNFL